MQHARVPPNGHTTLHTQLQLELNCAQNLDAHDSATSGSDARGTSSTGLRSQLSVSQGSVVALVSVVEHINSEPELLPDVDVLVEVAPVGTSSIVQAGRDRKISSASFFMLV